MADLLVSSYLMTLQKRLEREAMSDISYTSSGTFRLGGIKIYSQNADMQIH